MRVKERGCVCAREREEKRKRGAKECVRERERLNKLSLL
jgi:hypothetical protein